MYTSLMILHPVCKLSYISVDYLLNLFARRDVRINVYILAIIHFRICCTKRFVTESLKNLPISHIQSGGNEKLCPRNI